MKTYKVICVSGHEEKFYPIEVAAKMAGVSRSAMSQFFVKRDGMLGIEKYMYTEPYGKSGKRRYISKAGIVFYDVEKDKFKGNQYPGSENCKVTLQLGEAERKRSSKYVRALETQVAELRSENISLSAHLFSVNARLDTIMRILEKTQEKEKVGTQSILDLKPRDEIRMLVNEYAKNFEMPYSMVWNLLYQRAYYVLGYNVKQRAKNAKKENKLDQFEEDGMIDDLVMVAREMLKK